MHLGQSSVYKMRDPAHRVQNLEPGAGVRSGAVLNSAQLMLSYVIGVVEIYLEEVEDRVVDLCVFFLDVVAFWVTFSLG